ncbi:hypothetical protein AB0K00_10320 [Dactylosporangium sp. NPDC049525]|uniref:hypothetical protein n=1 Tax=Dactylosporangium sp. NPDC049525 TaxID=3154730 RepID=UPI00342E7127
MAANGTDLNAEAAGARLRPRETPEGVVEHAVHLLHCPGSDSALGPLELLVGDEVAGVGPVTAVGAAQLQFVRQRLVLVGVDAEQLRAAGALPTEEGE